MRAQEVAMPRPRIEIRTLRIALEGGVGGEGRVSSLSKKSLETWLRVIEGVDSSFVEADSSLSMSIASTSSPVESNVGSSRDLSTPNRISKSFA